MESKADAVAITTAGGVNTSISGLQQLQHPLIWSLIHDVSCMYNMQPPGTLQMELTGLYEC
jgi:hypothetical protein